MGPLPPGFPFRPCLLALVILFSALSPRSHGAEAEAKAEPCGLPGALRTAVQERFGSSRILNLSDLYEDERVAFKAQHKRACPGLTTGRFFTATERPATAFVLLGVGPQKDMRLVVARPALSSWTFVELDRMDAGGTAVVSTGRPGSSTEVSGQRVRASDTDIVLWTALETWQRAYTWNGRTFEKQETVQ